MELAFIVYAVSIIKSIIVLSAILALVICVVLVVTLVWYGDLGSSYSKTAEQIEKSKTFGRSLIKKLLISLFGCLFIATFTPSEKTAYMMVGAYAAQRVYEAPEVQKISGKVLTILESKLDSYIEDAEKKVKESTK